MRKAFLFSSRRRSHIHLLAHPTSIPGRLICFSPVRPVHPLGLVRLQRHRSWYSAFARNSSATHTSAGAAAENLAHFRHFISPEGNPSCSYTDLHYGSWFDMESTHVAYRTRLTPISCVVQVTSRPAADVVSALRASKPPPQV